MHHDRPENDQNEVPPHKKMRLNSPESIQTQREDHQETAILEGINLLNSSAPSSPDGNFSDQGSPYSTEAEMDGYKKHKYFSIELFFNPFKIKAIISPSNHRPNTYLPRKLQGRHPTDRKSVV